MNAEEIARQELILDYKKTYVMLRRAWVKQLKQASDSIERQRIKKTISWIDKTFKDTYKEITK